MSIAMKFALKSAMIILIERLEDQEFRGSDREGLDDLSLYNDLVEIYLKYFNEMPFGDDEIEAGVSRLQKVGFGT